MDAKLLIVLAVAFPAAGYCGHADPAGLLSHAPQVLIVPVQTPPPFWDKADSTRLAARQLGLDRPPSAEAPPPIVTAAGPAVSAATAVVGLAAASAQTRDNSDLSWQVARALQDQAAWIPSRVIGELVAAGLAKRGISQVRIRDGVQPVPGVDGCEMTIFFNKCYEPVHAYQKSTRSPFSYAGSEAGPGTVIVEVSVGDCEITGLSGYLILGIGLKLVAPDSGAVLDTARGTTMKKVNRDAFENGAGKFRTEFATAADVAVQKALRSLGL